MIKTIASIFLMSSLAQAEPIFKSEDHCVAWKTKKTLGLVSTVEPVGKNCEFEAKLAKNEKGKLSFKGRFPVSKFDSGEKDRDEEVEIILNTKKYPHILFSTDALSPTEWKKILGDRKGTISGTLMVAGKKRLIDPELIVEKTEKGFKITGNIKTTFTYFGIEPPSIAGGLVASVKDKLEFHFQFQTDKLKGFELLK